MRILFVANTLPPHDISGVGEQVIQLAAGLRECGHEVRILGRDPGTLPSDVSVTHLNLYDGTVEGFRHTTRPMFSVQYHPEASPGPHDADYLFHQFLESMETR